MDYCIPDVKLEGDIDASNIFIFLFFRRNNTYPKSYARYLAIVVVLLLSRVIMHGLAKVNFSFELYLQ